MFRFFRLVVMLLGLLFAIFFCAEQFVFGVGVDVSNVYVRAYEGRDIYLLSFTADNPNPNVVYSSRSLPSNLNPRFLSISSNGKWLFTISFANVGTGSDLF